MSNSTKDFPTNVIDLALRRRVHTPCEPASRPKSASAKRSARQFASLEVAAVLLRAGSSTTGGLASNDNIDPAYVVRLVIRHGLRHGRPPARLPRFIQGHLDICCQRGDAACLMAREWLNGNQAVLQRLAENSAASSETIAGERDPTGKGRA